MLPDLTDGSGNTVHLAVGAGKDAIIYVVNRDSMGKFNIANNNAIYQQISGQLPGSVFAMPAYFNGTLYYGAVGGTIQAFPITNAKLSTNATAHSSNSFPYPGTTPSISANGTSNGIVWAVENSNPAVLHAYDRDNHERTLQQQPGQRRTRPVRQRQQIHHAHSSERKVFVGTPNGVAVFGPLP